MDDYDERTRQRAHEIWEEEGRPEGREYSHWLRARAEIRAEDCGGPARPERFWTTGILGTGLIQPV